jgi:hypothetical protein
MNLSVFGFKFDLWKALIFMTLGFLISSHIVCGCCKMTMKETMTTLANAATLDHNNNADMKGSWMSKSLAYAGDMGYQSILDKHANYKGTPVPLENTLFYFQDNEFKPECCPTTYSTSTGCACTSPEQMKYLNERGGNRTMPTEF